MAPFFDSTDGTDTRQYSIHRCNYTGRFSLTTVTISSGSTGTTCYENDPRGARVWSCNAYATPQVRESRNERAKRLAEQRCYDINPPRKMQPLRRGLVHGYHNPSIIPLARSNC